VFLGAEEHRQLVHDLNTIYDAVNGLRDRLFGGDMAAYARAVGMTEEQVALIMRRRGHEPTRLARADLYRDDQGFKLLEINMGSTMGGFDNALLNRGMLNDPRVRDFVERHHLTYVDTMAHVVSTLMEECKVPTGTRPVMAAADWPDSFVTLAPQLHRSAAMLGPLGIEAYACDIAELRYADGRIWLREHPVDVVWRLFTLEDSLSEIGPPLVEPVIKAFEQGEVEVFTALDCRVYASKASLAMLSDEANRHLFSDVELESIERLLPWTRMVRPGPVTVDDRSVDLVEYVFANQDELVLKPTLLYSGVGVLLGWQTDPETWRARVEAAMNGPYVVQRRIHPAPDMMPVDGGGLEPWILVWGMYMMSGGMAGIWVRGTPGTESTVANMAQGATGTCCFYEPFTP
jgi:hypothetical protein